MMAALLQVDHHLIQAGQVILADKGFAGATFEKLLREDLDAHLVRPARRNSTDPARTRPSGRC